LLPFQIPRVTPSVGAINTRGQENLVKNLQFSKEIAVNLGNGTRYKNQSYKNKGSKFSGKSP